MTNGDPQEPVLAPLLLNFCTYNLCSTISKKLVHANNLELLHSFKDGKHLRGDFKSRHGYTPSLSPDLKIEVSNSNPVTTAVYLNNQEAKCEIKFYKNNFYHSV